MNPGPSERISTKTLIEKVADLVRKSWDESAPPELLFHSLETTESWLAMAKKIARKSDLPKEELHWIELALWFRSFGYLMQDDDLGQKRARDFLKDNLPEKEIEVVVRLIQSTLEGEAPQELKEEIMNDSIWSYLGKKSFLDQVVLLRLEQEHLRESNFTELQWFKFLENQLLENQFYTPYAEGKYEKRRRKNIAKLRSKLVKAKTTTIKKKTGKNFGRGIDTLYRVNFRNHINLSSIADGKANTMISINTILLSIIITLSSAGYALIDQLSEQSLRVTLPITLFLITCVISLIFAVLSTRPNVTSKEVVDILESGDDKPNLLFFGNFLKVSQDHFVDYLAELKKDQGQLYDDMSKDLYNLGKVIKRKYDLLTISYNCFIVGIVLTVLAFIFLQVL